MLRSLWRGAVCRCVGLRLETRLVWYLPIVLFLVVHVCALIYGNYIHFPNVDEVGHLPSGVSHWEYERFDMYRVNPPLVRLVAGMPAWFSGIDYDWSRYSIEPGNRPEFTIGAKRLSDVRLALHCDFIVPRMFCISFSILGALVLTHWVWWVFGPFSASVVCAFWCFSPDILAHAQTIVPDVGSVAMGLVACYALWHYIHKPSLEFAFLVGIGFGFALLTKLTWITGFATLPFTAFLCSWIWKEQLPLRSMSHRATDMILVLVTAITVLNAGYLFEGTGTTLGEYKFCSKTLGGADCNASTLGNRFAESWIAAIPVPLPKNYVMGADYLRFEVEAKRWSFLFGEWRFGSWPYFYLATTFVKTPLATLIGTAIGMALLIYWQRKDSLSVKTMTMLAAIGIPAIVCFSSVSLQGGFNHHHRYVMQIYPLLFVLVAAIGWKSPLQLANLRTSISAVLVVALLFSTASVAPHYLSFFNSLAGGPHNGWKTLGFSNIDWGQDLLFVADWIEKHPEARPIAFELDYFKMNGELFNLPRRSPKRFKAFSLEEVGKQSQEMVKQSGPCWYIVNVRKLYNLPDSEGLQYMQQMKQVDRIAYSFHVYCQETEFSEAK